MLKKSHVFVLGLATAGFLGFAAPMASAATIDGHGGLVNVSDNQVPVQVCGNDVNTNGAGIQVPLEGGSAVVPLLSPGSFNKGTSENNRGCVMQNNQEQGKGDGDSGGLVNVSNNQVPVQVCGNDVNSNGAGTQVPLEALGILVPVLSPHSVNLNEATNNRGCVSGNNQQNGKHHKHGACPCHGADSRTAMISHQSARPAGGNASAPGLGGLPVNALPVKGLPAVSGLTSGLQGK